MRIGGATGCLCVLAGALLALQGTVVRAQDEDQPEQRQRRSSDKRARGGGDEQGEGAANAGVRQAGAGGENDDAGAESQADGGGEREGKGEAEQQAPPADGLFSGPDLGPLREEFTGLMDDIVQARSRVAVLGRQLFQTKVRVKIDDESGDEQSLARIALELDGAPIYREDGSALGEDTRQVFEGFAAPGPHELTVIAEQRSRANDEFRYTLSDSYQLLVVRGKLTEILVVLGDDSEIGEDFPEDEEGEYEVTTRLRVATRELKDE